MKFIADLHIHSRFSRATSRTLTPEALALWGQKKGIKVIGTGDFTHPEWIKELKEKFEESEDGLFSLKPEYEKEIKGKVPSSCISKTLFILSGEISCIYKKDGKTRKIHHLILMPGFDSVDKLNRALDRIGNITSDGRPILGLDSKILLEMVLEASEKAFLIPAHVWTPWFSLFGSKSGFDEIEECFEDLTPQIHALETGLSSDPPMNRLLSALDKYLLVSNSDAHSPSKLGREANIFNTSPDYHGMIRAMIEKKGFEGTVEFYPEEGKYHMDGHRKCGIMLHPNETVRNKGLCPECGKPVTVGVFHRVAELADRENPLLKKNFYSLIPLSEILSEILGCGPNTKTVGSAYDKLLAELGPELGILMDRDINDIERAGGLLLSRAVSRMRKGDVIRQEGYDGEYGVIKLFRDSEKHELEGQKHLFKVEKTVVKKKRKTDLKNLKKKPVKEGSQKQVSFTDPILDPLNEKQREAVLYDKGHLLITAGPGTGKTLTLTHKIAHSILNLKIKPGQILALTFTNKAAGEMKQRIMSLLPDISGKDVNAATFHGFCLEVLKTDGGFIDIQPGFSVCSEKDANAIADEAVKLSGCGKKAASEFRSNLFSIKLSQSLDTGNGIYGRETRTLYQKYREILNELNMLDLEDLESETFRLFRDHPETCLKYSKKFQRIFVDEYQDTNRLQSAILKKLIKTDLNIICAIGDPDQAIYGFRDAERDNFFRFKHDFHEAKEITLDKNYRSVNRVLEASADLLGKEKPLEGNMHEGDHIRVCECSSPGEEAEMVVEQIEKLLGGTSYFSLDSRRVASHEDGEENIGFSDMAVLFRLNSQGDAFEEAFNRAGIPFIRSGEKSISNIYPVNVILRFLQACQFPENRFYQRAYADILLHGELNCDIDIREFPYNGSMEDFIDRIIQTHNFDMSFDESKRALARLKEIIYKVPCDNPSSLLNVLALDRGIDNTFMSGDRVSLMSLHAAKGLEWPVVFITGCEDNLIPLKIYGDCDEEEEKRLFYVGLTRAKSSLILSHSGKRVINGRTLEMEETPFLSLISEKLTAPVERSRWKPGKREKQLKLF